MALPRTTVQGLEAIGARDAGAAIDLPPRPPVLAPPSQTVPSEKPLLTDVMGLLQRCPQLTGSRAAVHVSSGGVSPRQAIRLEPNYEVGFATTAKDAVSIPVIAVGLITEAAQTGVIVAERLADAVSLARAMRYDPTWPWHAAAARGAQVRAPKQHWRSQPRKHKDASFGQR